MADQKPNYSLDQIPRFLRDTLPMNKVSVGQGSLDELKGYAASHPNAASYVQDSNPYAIKVLNSQQFNQGVLNHELSHAYQDQTKAKFAPVNPNNVYGYGGTAGLASTMQKGAKVTDFSPEQLARIVETHSNTFNQLAQKAQAGQLTQEDVNDYQQWRGAVSPLMQQFAALSGKKYSAQPAQPNTISDLPEFSDQSISLPANLPHRAAPVQPNPSQVVTGLFGGSQLATGTKIDDVTDNAQQGPITQSLLAGQNAPQQPAPQYVPPVVANTNKWAKVVQGALAGLGGGLSAGMQNVQDAGTSKGPHANGYQEGADASQKLQDQQQAQQQQATQQAQQNFENQNKTYQMNQEAQLNKARLAEANLNHLKLAMEMDGAPQAKQDAYYKEQDGHANDLRKQGMSELAEVPDLNSAAQWMQQNKKGTTDTVYTHHKGEDGKERIQIWENPDHVVDTGTINRGLAAHNYPAVPAGTTMNYGDYKSLLGKAQAAQAGELIKTREQAAKDKAEMARTQVTQAGENSRSDSKKPGGGDPNYISSLGDSIAAGKGTIDQVGYRDKTAVESYLSQKHPDLDQNSVMLTGEERKRRDLANNALHNLDTIQQTIQKRPDLVGMIQGRVSHGQTLAGTNDPDLATVNTALDNYALAGTGAHGIRAVQARVDARDALLNGLKNGPDALNASIETSRSSLKNLASAGSPHRTDGTPYKVGPAKGTQIQMNGITYESDGKQWVKVKAK